MSTMEAGSGRGPARRAWAGRLAGLALGLTLPPSLGVAQAVPSHLSERDLLFEAELVALGKVRSPEHWGSSPYRVAFSIRRDLIGQGEGTLSGPRLRGTLDWSRMARHLMEASTSNVLTVGWLFTEEGAEIMYEATGYAVPRIGGGGDEWQTVAALRFEAPDPPYEWLADVTGLWVGVFDVRTGEGRYRAYVPGLDAIAGAASDRRSGR